MEAPAKYERVVVVTDSFFFCVLCFLLCLFFSEILGVLLFQWALLVVWFSSSPEDFRPVFLSASKLPLMAV